MQRSTNGQYNRHREASERKRYNNTGVRCIIVRVERDKSKLPRREWQRNCFRGEGRREEGGRGRVGVLTSGRGFYQKRRAFPERRREIWEKSRASRLKYPDTCSHQLPRRASRLRTMAPRISAYVRQRSGAGRDRLLGNSNQLRGLRSTSFYVAAPWEETRPVFPFRGRASPLQRPKLHPSHSSGHLGWATRSLRQVRASAKEPHF